MTQVISFPVTCAYDDTFELELDPLSMNNASADSDGVHVNGEVSLRVISNYFIIKLFNSNIF